MNPGKRGRLAGMLALVYAVQGAFWPFLAVHLKDRGVDGRGRGWIFATMAIGSLAMPLGAGQLVDRLVAAEQFLAIVYGLGTGILVIFAWGGVTDPWVLFGWFLTYWLVMAPASGMSTTLALRNLSRPEEEFGGVRLWGTVGWMAVGWGVSVVLAVSGGSGSGRGVSEAFWIAAALSAVLSVYSMTLLPHTPPLARRGGAGIAEAIALIRRREVMVFLVSAFGVGLTTPFVYQVLPTYLESRGMPRSWIGAAMSLGQVPEIGALAVLPWLFRRLGSKATLAIGIGAWVLRYGTLAVDPPLWVAVAGIPLHGIGCACFAIGGQVFLDRSAPSDRRAGAQAILVVLTSGLGSLLGSVLAGESVARLDRESALVFVVPCGINAALLIYFCAGFRPGTANTARVGTVDAARPQRNDAVRGTVARVSSNLVTESADG